MSYLTKYINRFKSETSQGNLSSIIFELLVLNTPNIATEVRRRWIIGESIDGGLIGSYSWGEYAMFKAQMNPMAGGNVDLTLTGSLGENINIRKVGNNNYEIFSTDEKYMKIGNQYGFEEFGLNELQQDELFNDLFDFALQTLMQKVWASA